jgi:hypothetical protein
MMKDIPLKMFVFLIWTPQPATQFCVSPVVSSNMLDVREYQGSRMRDEFSRNTFFFYGRAVASAVRNKIEYT